MVLFSAADTFRLAYRHENRMDKTNLGALTAEAAGQLDVLDLERHALGVERNEVAVGQEANGVALSRLLDGGDGGRLPAEALLVARRELADEALEGRLAHEDLGRLLQLADLAERDRAGVEAALLLAALGGLGGLLGRLVDGGGLRLGHFWVSGF